MTPVKAILSMLAQAQFETSGSPSSPTPHFGYFNIVGSREAVPERDALLITRPGERDPPGWDVILVSTVPGFIGPRELPKLLHEILERLRENPNKAVVLECPEYLAVYNGFESFLKFLHTLRDYILMSGGRLYLITDPASWDERQFALLKRIEG
ncbi:DUF835 domain-containing protein [Thermococcus profundus]|nr:DUF835 domain-containing protein [Thermococcus profundus]